MHRHTRAVLIGAALPLVLALPASAHTHLSPSAAEAGEPTAFTVEVGHGCSIDGGDALPTRVVSVEIPEGAELVEAGDVEGWTTEVEDATVTWSGGELADGDPGSFPLTLTLQGEDGTDVPFRIYQECDDEHSYRWAGEEGADEPASIVTIGGDPEAGHGDGEEHAEEHAEEEGADAELAQAAEAATESATEAATAGAAGGAPSEGAAAPATASDAAADSAAPPAGAVAAGAGGTAAAGSPAGWVVAALAALGLGGGIVARRTRA